MKTQTNPTKYDYKTPIIMSEKQERDFNRHIYGAMVEAMGQGGKPTKEQFKSRVILCIKARIIAEQKTLSTDI
jgi:hypothetical protein